MNELRSSFTRNPYQHVRVHPGIRAVRHVDQGAGPRPPPPPACPDVKPGDDLQAAITAAASGSTLRLCPGAFRIISTLSVNKELTISGAGVEETILDGEETVGVLVVSGTGPVTVQNLTITRGFVSGEGRGGGIANFGALTVRRVAVTFCEAFKGGGIANFRFSALTLLEGSVVESNTARNDGGGILNDGTVIMNEGSFVQGNDPDDCEPDIGNCQ